MPPIDLVFALRRPETFHWESDSGYSAAVQKKLLQAHSLVRQSSELQDHRTEAEAMLLKLTGRAMSDRQRMLLYYLLAQCSRMRDFSVGEHFFQALEYCSRAEQLATRSENLGALVDLHELKGTLYRARSMYWAASDEFAIALNLLSEHAADSTSADPEFEATLASKAGAIEFALGNFERAMKYVLWSEVLLPLTAMDVESRGTLAWTSAFLHRQANDLLTALRRVSEAADLFLQLPPRNSTCRVLSLAGDIALDAAELPEDVNGASGADHFAAARRFIDEAFRIGRDASDTSGTHLTELVLARFERLCDPGAAVDPERRIRSVLAKARKAGDMSLIAEAQTALGFDFLARGIKQKAKYWFTQAAKTSERMLAPGLGYLAQRGLRRADALDDARE